MIQWYQQLLVTQPNYSTNQPRKYFRRNRIPDCKYYWHLLTVTDSLLTVTDSLLTSTDSYWHLITVTDKLGPNTRY